MRDAHRRVRDVDVLSPRSARTVGIDAQVLVLDLDLDIIGQLGPHEDRGERRVSSRGLVEWRNPHQPVHPRLGQEEAIGVVTADGHGRALDARFVARLKVDDLALEAAALGPPQVGAQKHLGPILRLGAASARVHRQDGVGVVVLAAEHLLDLGRLDLGRKVVESAGQIVDDMLALSGPLDEHLEIVTPLRERLGEVVVFLQTLATPEDLLRRLGVVPKIRVCRLSLEAGDLVSRAGCVKDSSADRRRASRDPGSDEPVLPRRCPRCSSVQRRDQDAAGEVRRRLMPTITNTIAAQA